MKNLKYIIYLIISFLSIISLIEKEEIAVLFLDEEPNYIQPYYCSDYSELPDNDIIQYNRRYSENKHAISIKLPSDNPADYIVTILELKKFPTYFLIPFCKISEEKKYLHLFSLY